MANGISQHRNLGVGVWDANACLVSGMILVAAALNLVAQEIMRPYAGSHPLIRHGVGIGMGAGVVLGAEVLASRIKAIDLPSMYIGAGGGFLVAWGVLLRSTPLDAVLTGALMGGMLAGCLALRKARIRG